MINNYPIPGGYYEFRAVFLDSIAPEYGTLKFSYSHFIVLLPPFLS